MIYHWSIIWLGFCDDTSTEIVLVVKNPQETIYGLKSILKETCLILTNIGSFLMKIGPFFMKICDSCSKFWVDFEFQCQIDPNTQKPWFFFFFLDFYIKSQKCFFLCCGPYSLTRLAVSVQNVRAKYSEILVLREADRSPKKKKPLPLS